MIEPREKGFAMTSHEIGHKTLDRKLKYQSNLKKFDQMVNSPLNNEPQSFFKIVPSLFTPNRLQVFENDDLYYHILKVSDHLEHGQRLHNISWRVMNKTPRVEQLKVRKRDGVKNIYKMITPRVIPQQMQQQQMQQQQHQQQQQQQQLPSGQPSVTQKHTLPTTTHNADAVKSAGSSASSLFKRPSSTLFNKTTVNSRKDTQPAHSLFKTPTPPAETKEATPTSGHDYHKVYYSSDEDIYSSDEDESSSEISDDDDEDFYNDEEFEIYSNRKLSYTTTTDSKNNVLGNMETDNNEQQHSTGSNNKRKINDVDEKKHENLVRDRCNNKSMVKFYQQKWDRTMLRNYHKKAATEKSQSDVSLANITSNTRNSHTSKPEAACDLITNDMLLDNQSSRSSGRDSHNPLVPTTSNQSNTNNANPHLVLFRRGSFGSMASEATRKRYVHPSNAPPSAQTLLPIAFQTHMFVPNDISLQRQQMEQRKILLDDDGAGAGNTAHSDDDRDVVDAVDDVEEDSLFYSERTRELGASRPKTAHNTRPIPHHPHPKTQHSTGQSLFTGGRTRG